MVIALATEPFDVLAIGSVSDTPHNINGTGYVVLNEGSPGIPVNTGDEIISVLLRWDTDDISHQGPKDVSIGLYNHSPRTLLVSGGEVSVPDSVGYYYSEHVLSTPYIVPDGVSSIDVGVFVDGLNMVLTSASGVSSNIRIDSGNTYSVFPNTWVVDSTLCTGCSFWCGLKITARYGIVTEDDRDTIVLDGEPPEREKFVGADSSAG